MKKFSIIIILVLLPAMAFSQKPPYKNKNISSEQRATDLLGRMTLDEKVAQLQCHWYDKRYFFTNGDFDEAKAVKVMPYGVGQLARLCEDLRPQPANVFHATLHPRDAARLYNKVQKYFITKTRLGIPVLCHEEGLHGQQTADATSFPSPIGMASSWDTALMHDVYTCVAKEIRSKGGNMVLAPVVDVVRDPRWGRTEETMGEDPYLNSRMGAEIVKAFQGGNIMNIAGDHVAATLKHFGVHGQSEGGQNTAPSFMDERNAMEVFLKPFQYCIREASPFNIMVTYNELWGIPAHANKHLLKDILRGDFGFQGVVVSDYQGISNLRDIDSVATDYDASGIKAFNAGVDVELPMVFGFKNLAQAVKDGKVSEAAIDSAVYRVLLEKFRLGLFDNPYVDPDRAEKIVGCKEHRDIAYRAATESMVLLKNDNNFLPLDKNKVKTIAFIGPNANRCILGGYASTPRDTITPLRAIKEKYGDKMNILYSEGVRLTDVNSPFPEKIRLITYDENRQRIADAVETAKNADVVVLFVGSNESITREAYSTTAPGDVSTLDLLSGQKELISQITALGKPTCAFVNSGTTLNLSELSKQVPALMQCWYLGQEGGYAMVDALFGDVNPSGKLTISFPRDAGHIPAYYSYKPSSRRGYNLGQDVTPLYPFGFGLSYTKYQYSNLRLSSSTMGKGDKVTASVDITNIGTKDGTEIAEMYIRDDFSSATRPVKELKGFRRVALKAGETQTVTFDIDAESLSFYDADMKWTAEPGDFTIMVGPSSDKCENIKLHLQ
jgi:beta-glucosidase